MKKLFLSFISLLILSSPKAETYFMTLNKLKSDYHKTPESYSYWKENIAKESSSPKDYRQYLKEARCSREIVGFELSLSPTDDNSQETLEMIFSKKPLPKISSFSTMVNGNILYMLPNKKCSKYLMVCSEQDKDFIKDILKKFTFSELETLKHRKKIDFTISPEIFLEERSDFIGPLVSIRRARELDNMISISTDTKDLTISTENNDITSLSPDPVSCSTLSVNVDCAESDSAPSTTKSWSASILGFLYGKSS